MELMPLNIAGKILLDLLKVNENLMGGKVSLTWTPLNLTNGVHHHQWPASIALTAPDRSAHDPTAAHARTAAPTHAKVAH